MQSSSDGSWEELKNEINNEIVEQSEEQDRYFAEQQEQYNFEIQKISFLLKNLKMLKKYPNEYINYNLRTYVVISMLNILNYEAQQFRDTILLKINIFHLKNFQKFSASEEYYKLLDEMDAYLNQFESLQIKLSKQKSKSQQQLQSNQAAPNLFISKKIYTDTKDQLFKLYQKYLLEVQQEIRDPLTNKIKIKIAFFLFMSSKHDYIFDTKLIKKNFSLWNRGNDTGKFSFDKLLKQVDEHNTERVVALLERINLNINIYSKF